MKKRGSGGDDRLTGGSRADELSGLGGSDALFGREGRNSLYGGSGDDFLEGGPGEDRLFGGRGIDMVSYADATAGVTVDLTDPTRNTGDAEGDVFSSIEDVLGSLHDDVITGNQRQNFLLGDLGDDVLIGVAGVTFLMGGAGADRLVSLGGSTSAVYWDSPIGLTVDLAAPERNTGIALGDSYAAVCGLEGTIFDDSLHGNGKGNVIFAFAGDDRLSGRGGDDLLDGGAGGDALYGGSGFDRAVYWEAERAVVADLKDPTRNVGDARGDSYRGIEGLEGSAFDDRLGGDGGDNGLFGGDGDDRLYGRGGADTLWGGAGADILSGGAGQDFAVYWDSPEGLALDLAAPSRNTGEAAGDGYRSIEGLEGSDFDDRIGGDGRGNVLMGGDGEDRLYGRDGADDLVGGAGDDALFGGRGGDFLNGGSGADRLDGGAGEDRAIYWGATEGVRADLGDATSNTGEAAGDVYRAIESLGGSSFDDQLVGNAGNNRLFGGAGADRLLGGAGDDDLFGEAGDDRLHGGGGDDYLNGGAGSDRYYGGSGVDRVLYREAGARVVADLLSPLRNSGEASGDFYRGVEAMEGSAFDDILRGDDRQNSLFGGLGDDRLVGRGGDDSLFGGLGADELIGGAGLDAFVFADRPEDGQPDRLPDFTSGVDNLVLLASAFESLAAGDLSRSAFHRGEEASGLAHRLLYDEARGELRFDPDGSDVRDAILFARLNPGDRLVFGDIAIIDA